MRSEKDKELFLKSIELIRKINAYIRDNDLEELKSILTSHPEILDRNFFGSGLLGLLNYASMEGRTEICKMLVGMGIDIDACPEHNYTPLSEAAMNGHIETVKWLVENGARVDSFPTDITTPLMSAIIFGHGEIAKYLIQHGADINRLQRKSNDSPLDLALIWGQEDIAGILRSMSAISIMAETDWSKEYGGPIIQYINDNVGRVLPIQLTQIVGQQTVGQRIAIVNKGRQKLLFTVGLFAVHAPMLELAIVLPAEWNIHDQSSANQFPPALLLALSARIGEGLRIEEGFCIHADDPEYKDLTWPPAIAGFCVCDHEWGGDESGEGDIPPEDRVRLWTLIPVKTSKKGFPAQSIEKNKQAGWNKLTLNLN